MNNLIYIEKARVIRVGEFATGNGNNGPWAVMPVKVEWEYQYNDAQNVPQTGKQSAVAVFSGEMATWARDNVKAGNPYNGTPDTYLNLWLRLWGDFDNVKRQDGSIWLKDNNRVNVATAQIWHA